VFGLAKFAELSAPPGDVRKFLFASEHEGKAWAEAENCDDHNRSRASHKGLNLVASKLNLA
jgi:hypothetical protein